MPRVYLPLLPLPVLAILVAIAACNEPRSEVVSHVIPPPAAEAIASAKPSAPALAPPAAAPPQEDPPSAEEVKAFEKPVRK